ncbi:MAG: GNAT family N-acetyltransferase [Rhizobiales bacterium]|nr:GNAT family N-acetyltransferase [Hyphomicrobiales bacterium]
MPFVVEGLSGNHERRNFDCGVAVLDRYLKEQAGQDARRRVSLCYVACEIGQKIVAGYYTLSAGDVPLQDIPDELARKLPRYPVVPIIRIGRLAVDRTFQGRRLGAALLWDAAMRALRAEMGVFALAVDAKDEAASAFYRNFGFQPFASAPDQLILPLATFAKVAGAPGSGA